MPSFYEFFAGGGMARTGLGAGWQCIFANDISPMKAAAYLQNFPDSHDLFTLCDINDVVAEELPGKPDLIWGSFPCQDLSLAGVGKGLNGSRSGLIWHLLTTVSKLKRRGRGPKVIVLENVTGLLNSRGGRDFYDILKVLRNERFLYGTMMMDAARFLPQSRPRIFLVAVDIDQVCVNPSLVNGRFSTDYPWTASRLDRLWDESPADLRGSWVWWNLPSVTPRRSTIADIIDEQAATWDTAEYTKRLLSLMSPLHVSKVEDARCLGREVIGTLYRRTRLLGGVRTQRVEVRFDGVSGCLRTPSGGSSRQRLIFIKGDRIRSRLMSTREAARLMGIPDSYRLPPSYNDGYQIAGDGVAVPVVNWLATKLLLPLCSDSNAIIEDEAQLLYA